MASTKRKSSGGGGSDDDTTSWRVTRSVTQKLHNSESVATETETETETKTKSKERLQTKKVKSKADTTVAVAVAAPSISSSTTCNPPTIVIEHCKQCSRFKTRANLVHKGLEEAVPGITVLINPEKPRRGCFEIRQEGGQTFISLLNLKRPFKPMTDLDMKEVIDAIIKKIKA